MTLKLARSSAKRGPCRGRIAAAGGDFRPARGLAHVASALLVLLALARTAGADVKRYGGTPDELLPYREVGEPYHRFYLEPPAKLPPARAVPMPADEIRIGLLAPLEDSRDVPYGKAMLEGATLAIEEAGARGKLHGKQLKLVTENALPIWGAAGNSLHKLSSQGVSAVLGAFAPDDGHVSLRLSLKIEVPLVNSATSDPTLTEHAIPWMVRTCASDRNFCYALALAMLRDRKYQKVAMFRENSSYGRRGHGYFKSACARLGRPIGLEMRYKPGDTDFRDQLTRLHEERPDAIMLFASAREGGRIVKQSRQMGIKLPIFGSHLLADPEFLAEAGDAAEGVVLVTDFDPTRDDPVLQAFRTRYRARFGHDPLAVAAHTYDGARLLIEAIERKGPARRDVMEGLMEHRGKPFTGVTGTFDLDPSMTRVGPVHFARMEKGRLKFHGPRCPDK